MLCLGIILALAILVIEMLMGGSVLLFHNVPSLLLVIGCTIFLILASYGGKGLKLLFVAPFVRNLSPEDVTLSIAVYKDAKTYLIALGFIGFLIGAVLMLASLEYFDDVSKIGSGLAICVLTVFYGIVFAYFICHPVLRQLEKKL